MGMSFGMAIDMWSVGCMMAELLLGRSLFTGASPGDQLYQYLQLLYDPALDPGHTMLSRSQHLLPFPLRLNYDSEPSIPHPSTPRQIISQPPPLPASSASVSNDRHTSQPLLDSKAMAKASPPLPRTDMASADRDPRDAPHTPSRSPAPPRRVHRSASGARLQALFPGVPVDALDFMLACLHLDPATRITAATARNHLFLAAVKPAPQPRNLKFSYV